MTDTPAAPKKLFIKTYGCQMNVYDSDRMADSLAGEGYVVADRPEDADLVLLNTCHIREKASEKVFSELGRLDEIRAERRAAGADMLIGVAGCVAQAEGEEIVRRAPGVDLVVGPQSYHRLPELVARAGIGVRPSNGREAAAAAARGHHRPRPHLLPHRAGGLRQVLLVLRRALYPRRRSQPPRCADHARGRGAGRRRRHGAHPARPERQRLSWRRRTRPQRWPRRPAAAAGGAPRPQPAALHHQPSARRG